MSYYKKFIRAAQNHKQAAWELKVALWEARKHERVPWADLHSQAGVTRQTANNWYDEVNQVMTAENHPEPRLVTVDVNRIDDVARAAVLRALGESTEAG